MAGREAQLLTGDDDDDIGGDIPASNNLPPGLANGGEAAQRQTRHEAEPEFEIIETDEHFNPIGEARLDEGEEVPPQETQQEREIREAKPKPPKSAKRREAKDRTLSELNYLRSQVQELQARVTDNVEPRLTEFDRSRHQAEVAAVDSALKEAEQIAVRAYQKMSDAMINSDGEAFTKALQERDEAMAAGQRLQLRKNIMTNQGGQAPDARQQTQPTQQQQRPVAPLPTVVQEHIRDFTDDFPWYNPKSGDIDSQIVLMLDNQIAAEGFDPTTPDYWDELRDRMHRRLPDKFEAAPRQQRQAAPRQQVAPQKRGPQIGGGSDRAPSGGGREQVYISPDRKTAMVAAGVLDSDGRTVVNREKFNRYLKQYRDFDRANGVVRQ